MKKEEVKIALAKLGCSKTEIDERIRIEELRRKGIKEMNRKLDIAGIIKYMEL